MINNHSDKIIDHLWIGDRISATDSDFLSQNKVKLVVNCTKDLQIPMVYQRLGIQVIRLPINDINNQDSNTLLRNEIDGIVDTIHGYRKNGLNVLVHCYAGMSRSATVVASYLIKHYDHQAALAIMYIQSKRPITFQPQPMFIDFMTSLEKMKSKID